MSFIPNANVQRGYIQECWYNFAQNKGALIGAFIIVCAILIGVFVDFIAPYDPTLQVKNALLVPPVWDAEGSWLYILGTDDLGRDIFSRLIHGTKISLGVGALVVCLSCSLGMMIGLIAGYFGGLIDNIIMRWVDILLVLPSLLMCIALVAVLGPSLTNATLAIAFVALPSYIRLTRAAVLSEVNLEYVTASKVVGASHLRLMFIDILPNCLSPLIVHASLGFSWAILELAVLGFLGIGAQAPTPEWGTMLSEAVPFIQRAWWMITFPGLIILLIVMAFNLIGEGLRDALDPKLKQ